MTENHSALDWFYHFHQHSITDLGGLVHEDFVKLEGEVKVNESPAQKVLLESHQQVINRILESLKEEKPDPATIFQQGLTALSDVEKERFILENLLEAVKRGESFSNMLGRFNALKLTNYEISTIPPEIITTTESNNQGVTNLTSSKGTGRLLEKLLDRLKKFALKIMQLLINAMKMLPKFISIQPIVGFAGPFPTFSFQLDLQTESLNLYDLFQDLTKGLIGTP
jgi:hypothetical protein